MRGAQVAFPLSPQRTSSKHPVSEQDLATHWIEATDDRKDLSCISRCLAFLPKQWQPQNIARRVFASALFLQAYAQKTTIQPADIVNLKKVADPVVSPDGKLVAYTVEIPVPAAQHRNAHIWLAPAASTDGRPPLCLQRCRGRLARLVARRHSPCLSLQPS